MVIALVAPAAQASAQTGVAQDAWCGTYADRAVAQYTDAVAHPQCSVKVDLVWQPSREYHVKACMSVPRALAEAQTASRDSVLKACSTAQPPIAAVPLPNELQQCERSILRVCGTWTLSGQQYVATWPNGAKATLSVTRFDGHSMALHRVDAADSLTAGMTADYLGDVDGGKVKGKVTFTWPGHTPPVGYGTWDATFTPPPAATPAPVTPAPPVPAPASPTPSGPPASGAGVAATNSPNAGSGGGADCPLPAVPATWLDPSYAAAGGQMWKIEKNVLSYFDTRERKQVSYPVMRPLVWRRWAACAPPLFVTTMDVSGWWIWISEDRREAKVFDVMKGNLYVLPVRSVPVDLVLAEEAGKP